MHRHTTLTRWALGLFALALMASQAVAADAAGTWTWKFTPPNGGEEREITLTLKQDGEKLTGTLAMGPNRMVEIQNGTIKNDALAFETVFERDGNRFTSKYQGSVSGDTIKGKIERQRDGQTMTRDWEAKRQK